MNDLESQEKIAAIKRSLEDISQLREEGELYFLIVSIDEYLKERNLKSSNKYALEFLNIFKESISIKKKNLYWLSNKNATKENIINNLDYLSKNIKQNDKILIYISAHGYQNEMSDFFVPYDGYKKNFNTCITNQYIFKTFSQSKIDTAFLCFDLKVSNNDNETSRNLTVDAKQKFLYKKQKKEIDYFNQYIDFFHKKSIQRLRESFIILKDNMPQRSLNKNILPNSNILKPIDPLLQFLNNRHSEFLRNMIINNTKLVLIELVHVLENNDPSLLRTVTTLSYKLTQYENLYSKSEIEKAEYQDNKLLIDEVTCEVIEKIKNRGFYLVRTPNYNTTLENKEKVKILFASANPIDTNTLRLDKEAREIEYELLKSKNRDQFELIKVIALRVEDLQMALLNHSPKFVHFSGHGNCNGIALLNNDDESIIVNSKPLSQLFKLFSSDIQCIFLNSCHSLSQSEEISKHIAKVICMNSSVPDQVAIHFAIAFYRSLASGRNIDFSFEFAKNSIDLHNIGGSDIPVLLPYQ